MKIFISHSSHDRWIARQVEAEIQKLGCETFLDEKDIETGSPIESVIQPHMSTCDEVLLLLSPAALASHWVLIELGGAIALQKRLIAILHHVDVDSLPDPLKPRLRRDLNDIDRYFAELERRCRSGADGPAPGREPGATVAPRRPKLKPGDRVRTARRPQAPFVTPDGTEVTWTEDMTAHAGESATVVAAEDDDTVRLDIDGNWWASPWLEPAEDE